MGGDDNSRLGSRITFNCNATCRVKQRLDGLTKPKLLLVSDIILIPYEMHTLSRSGWTILQD
ncbi:hypothetical protein YC2023_007765 [Brassica napus]